MSRANSQVLTFANIKGGVGKTTSVVNIAYILANDFGKRVLVIDADDQGNATKALGVREQFDRQRETLWYALDHKVSYEQVIVDSPYKNIWVIPSTKELKGAQLAFGQSARRLKLFSRLLKNYEKDFDYVLIDTKPQINVLLQAALAASDWYVIPSFPEPDSYDGFVDLVAECEEIFEEENPKLTCLGVLFTCVKKIPAHEAYVKFIGRHLKQAEIPLLKPPIRSSNSMATGGLHNCPAVSMAGAYAVRSDYLKLTKSLMRALNRSASAKAVRPDLEVLGLDSNKDEAVDGGLTIQERMDSIPISLK